MKTMKLYDSVERIFNELRTVGLDRNATLEERDLMPFDQYHYHGTAALDEAARALALTPSSRVLDIGSGIGGPARYLAATVGCHVTALELQPDLDRTAAELTARCGLGARVRHVSGDILAGVPDAGSYDAVISFLAFLHIPDRQRLFRRCVEALRPEGALYIEDFTLLTEPNVKDRELLRVKVQCAYAPRPEEYVAQLEAGGFSRVLFRDMTSSWRVFVAERLKEFRAAREQNIATHGHRITAGLDDFYATVAALFERGVTGGARITARRNS